MRKITISMILALSALSSNANADALGLYIGGGVWDHDPSGSFGTDGVNDPQINMESDLKYSGEKDSYVYAAFEHFVPLVPNLRVERSSMGYTAVNIDNTDAILYWRLLDNWVNFDLGFTARKLDADFTVGNQTVAVSETIPMVYAAVQFDLPLTGLSVGADINTISYSDASYSDVRIRALYEMGVIGFELGLKTTNLELKGLDKINADLEFKGMMVGAFLHF